MTAGFAATLEFDCDTSGGVCFTVVNGPSMPQSPTVYQSSPNNSAGCCVRLEPFPQASESTEQYLSHPQHIRSGCFGFNGIFFAISVGQGSSARDYD